MAKKKFRLDDFTKGWFIGDFEPTLYRTDDFEVSVKRYKKGDTDEVHYHKVATEYTVVIDGTYKINGSIFKAGDIKVFRPGEVSKFECLESGSNVIVKVPSVKGDKYVVAGDTKNHSGC